MHVMCIWWERSEVAGCLVVYEGVSCVICLKFPTEKDSESIYVHLYQPVIWTVVLSKSNQSEVSIGHPDRK